MILLAMNHLLTRLLFVFNVLIFVTKQNEIELKIARHNYNSVVFRIRIKCDIIIDKNCLTYRRLSLNLPRLGFVRLCVTEINRCISEI